jgi:hypothetical protein
VSIHTGHQRQTKPSNSNWVSYTLASSHPSIGSHVISVGHSRPRTEHVAGPEDNIKYKIGIHKQLPGMTF